ncbi:MAG TPA: CPBP family intramembrane glutamic endopeptidase [Sulfurovum sp.]|uniref:CPBP family intramembrane glutamic endopeptidase n=1 Tax=Sulfurovum sp. TaxID=1969726 RepID=UPI002F92C14C
MDHTGIYGSLMHSRTYLVSELLGIFVIVPAAIYALLPVPVLPFLWVVVVFSIWALFKDRSFDRDTLWHASELKKNYRLVLKQFILIAAVMVALVYFFSPDHLFSLLKKDPLLWALIVILYPLLSVYPQELLYRTFFFHRYRMLFQQKWQMITVNALLFGYMHVIFQNWVAVLLTAAGGFLFAAMYERTRSTLLVSVAHALYGNLLFTLGLGTYFYNGTMLTLS